MSLPIIYMVFVFICLGIAVGILTAILYSIVLAGRAISRKVKEERQSGMNAIKAIAYISWILYIIGGLIVFSSYLNLVPPGVGWIGWVIAMIGWGLQFVRKRQ